MDAVVEARAEQKCQKASHTCWTMFDLPSSTHLNDLCVGKTTCADTWDLSPLPFHL